MSISMVVGTLVIKRDTTSVYDVGEGIWSAEFMLQRNNSKPC